MVDLLSSVLCKASSHSIYKYQDLQPFLSTSDANMHPLHQRAVLPMIEDIDNIGTHVFPIKLKPTSSLPRVSNPGDDAAPFTATAHLILVPRSPSAQHDFAHIY